MTEAQPPKKAPNDVPLTLEQVEKPAKAGKLQRRISELEVLIRARYPLIYVVTWEEGRVLGLVGDLAAQRDKKVFEWSVTTGLVPGGTSIQSQKNRDAATQAAADPPKPGLPGRWYD